MWISDTWALLFGDTIDDLSKRGEETSNELEKFRSANEALLKQVDELREAGEKLEQENISLRAHNKKLEEIIERLSGA